MQLLYLGKGRDRSVGPSLCSKRQSLKNSQLPSSITKDDVLLSKYGSSGLFRFPSALKYTRVLAMKEAVLEENYVWHRYLPGA